MRNPGLEHPLPSPPPARTSPASLLPFSASVGTPQPVGEGGSREGEEEATENEQQRDVEGGKQAWEDPGKRGPRRQMGRLQERHGPTALASRGDQGHQAPSPPPALGAPWPQQPQKPQPRVEGKKFQCDITEAKEKGGQGPRQNRLQAPRAASKSNPPPPSPLHPPHLCQGVRAPPVRLALRRLRSGGHTGSRWVIVLILPGVVPARATVVAVHPISVVFLFVITPWRGS